MEGNAVLECAGAKLRRTQAETLEWLVDWVLEHRDGKTDACLILADWLEELSGAQRISILHATSAGHTLALAQRLRTAIAGAPA